MRGDACLEPGPLGDFVMWLVTERTKTKEKQTKKEKEKTSLNFTKDVNINFIEKIPLKIFQNIG